MFKIVRLEQPILCYKITAWKYWDSTIIIAERDEENDLIYSEDS